MHGPTNVKRTDGCDMTLIQISHRAPSRTRCVGK